MKKNKLLMPLLTSSVLLTASPMILTTSCSSGEKEVTYFNFDSTNSDKKEHEFYKTDTLVKEFKYIFNATELNDLTNVKTIAIITQNNSNFSIAQVYSKHKDKQLTVYVDVVVKAGVFSLKDKDGKLEKKQEIKFDIKLSSDKDGWAQKETGFVFSAQPIE